MTTRPPAAPDRKGRWVRRATLIGLVAALAACTGGTAPDPDPEATTPEPVVTTAEPASGPDDVRAHGQAVTSGDLTVYVAAAGAQISTVALEDGAVQVDVTLPPPGPDHGAIQLRIAGPEGSTVDLLADDTAVLRDPEGRVLAGLTRPSTVTDDPDDPAPSARGADEEDLLTWSFSTTDPTQPPPAGAASLVLATSAVRSATWADRDDEGGRSLAVVPTTWARTGGLAASEAVWAQLIALVPEADLPQMHDQLVCHTIGAPDKESWNLEPWRPDVGLLATMAARCNAD